MNLMSKALMVQNSEKLERMQAELAHHIFKIEAENAKLRECVEFYADLDEEAIGYDIRGVTYARQVLKELGGGINEFFIKNYII